MKIKNITETNSSIIELENEKFSYERYAPECWNIIIGESIENTMLSVDVCNFLIFSFLLLFSLLGLVMTVVFGINELINDNENNEM